MDTLEWGSSERAGGLRRWRGPGVRWSGPRLATGLGITGVALAVAAQALPWASLGAATGATGSIGLERLNSVPVFGYYICWIALLGLAGVVLSGARPTTRRAAAGAAIGLIAAQVMLLAGIARSIFTFGDLTDSLGAVATGGTASGLSVHPGIGLFCGALAVGFVLAAVLLAVRRRGPVLSAASMGPAAAALADEPEDLTVVPMGPVDESLFTRHGGAQAETVFGGAEHPQRLPRGAQAETVFGGASAGGRPGQAGRSPSSREDQDHHPQRLPEGS